MFDRAEADKRRNQIPISLTLTDGTKIEGNIASSRDNMTEILSDGNAFLEIVDLKGQSSFLSKKSITWIAERQMPKSGNLKGKIKALSSDNPFIVLGIGVDADEREIAQAYQRLSERYHPDRLSKMELPSEMIEYGAAMQVRLNAAYQSIQRSHSASPQAAPQSTEQVYESRPHWIDQHQVQ